MYPVLATYGRRLKKFFFRHCYQDKKNFFLTNRNFFDFLKTPKIDCGGTLKHLREPNV